MASINHPVDGSRLRYTRVSRRLPPPGGGREGGGGQRGKSSSQLGVRNI